VDLPDHRPTPLEVLLEKETNKRMDLLVDELLMQMRGGAKPALQV